MTVQENLVASIASDPTPGLWTQVTAFLCLGVFYVLTGPDNHSLSIDAYSYATMITTGDFWNVEQPRQFLWVAAMQGLYHGLGFFSSAPDLFRIIGLAGALQAALAVIVFARILGRDFAQDTRTAWLTAGLFATSYGVWRYATEIEVYSTAVLLSLLLIHLTFGLAMRGGDSDLKRRIVPLAILGGLSTLTYQPIGIVAGIIVPFFLVVRWYWRWLVIYCLVSGTIVVAGFAVAYLFGDNASLVGPVAFIFDAKELNPAKPDPTAAVKIAFAIGHDILSTYWTFAFGTFQDFFTRIAPDRFFDEEIYVAERGGWLAWVPLVTLPCAGLLTLAALVTALQRRLQIRFSAPEATLLAWFMVHGAMMVVLSPAGVEGWILGVVPLMLFAGIRLVGPCVAAGKATVIFLIFGVFLAHNGLAGIGMQMGKSGDYLLTRGQALLAKAGPADLVVIASDWSLYKYLLYSGEINIVQIPQSKPEAVRVEIEATLAQGNRVFLTDTVMAPPPSIVAADPSLARELTALARVYQERATRFATGDAGGAYVIEPEKTAQ